MKLKSVLIRLGVSKMIPNGVGVFANNRILAGTIIGESKKCGDDILLPWNRMKELDAATQKFVMDFCLGTPEGFYSNKDLNYISMPWFMNHSCNGNVGFNKDGDFITIRDIEESEEICYDYGLGESNPDFKMICLCGSNNCRKIITGNDWKDHKFREKNADYILPTLRKIK